MVRWLGRMWGWVRHLADDALPLPADERAERDQPEPNADPEAEARQRRLTIHLLEKRGKGGTR